MTNTSSKDILRSTIVMFLFVGLVGIWMGGCETQDQKVEKLIQQLKEDNDWHAAEALGSIGEGAVDTVPALIQALKDQNSKVCLNVARAH
ncbi:TPA: HEAT repeat domain-containing protein [Candidatus Poribacteria bacterium]|nr:HEAT repeat domain-containing protein [Candidatus Poribacteria bacterium]HIA68914.1 HEAT repeat domain-containing protein [Candidatus Poribacteria bacterium]HIN31649.1 HEAT repeat domain-containing protein [Candidatus Poribacteria bacterium]HIO45746.1 HEAT repeat domain-containing protein [Candidatus Poribacteria bacterium]HIO82297.1 HEAT repeat domain-containing protein [Candidatus Poribacteria bacterium]